MKGVSDSQHIKQRVHHRQMLGCQAALFHAVFADNDPEFACLFGDYVHATRDCDDGWVVVAPPATLDPRHTQHA